MRVAWTVTEDVEKMLECGGSDGGGVNVRGEHTIYMCADARARASAMLRMAGSEGECVKMLENGCGCAINAASPGRLRNFSYEHCCHWLTMALQSCAPRAKAKRKRKCCGIVVRDHRCTAV